jgi:hypothetical protein
LQSSEAATRPRRTGAVGIAADGPPAATDVPSTVSLWCRQRGRRFYPGAVLATLLLQPHLTAPRGQLQGVEVVRLLVVLQGPTHAVAPRRDDGFIGDLGAGSGGLGGHDWGSQRSWDRESAPLRVALMLEVADRIGRVESCGCGVTVSGVMAMGTSYTSSSAATGVTHRAHPTSYRPMSLIILFSHSSHLVQMMTCGGASWSSQSYRKHPCCRSRRRLKGTARGRQELKNDEDENCDERAHRPPVHADRRPRPDQIETVQKTAHT